MSISPSFKFLFKINVNGYIIFHHASLIHQFPTVEYWGYYPIFYGINYVVRNIFVLKYLSIYLGYILRTDIFTWKHIQLLIEKLFGNSVISFYFSGGKTVSYSYFKFRLFYYK